jgi:hypothetical protein
VFSQLWFRTSTSIEMCGEIMLSDMSLGTSPDTMMDLRSHLKPRMVVLRYLKYSVVAVLALVHVVSGEKPIVYIVLYNVLLSYICGLETKNIVHTIAPYGYLKEVIQSLTSCSMLPLSSLSLCCVT